MELLCESTCEVLEEISPFPVEVDRSSDDSEEGDYADDAADGHPRRTNFVATVETAERLCDAVEFLVDGFWRLFLFRWSGVWFGHGGSVAAFPLPAGEG